jgi:hypothetical protein
VATVTEHYILDRWEMGVHTTPLLGTVPDLAMNNERLPICCLPNGPLLSFQAGAGSSADAKLLSAYLSSQSILQSFGWPITIESDQTIQK